MKCINCEIEIDPKFVKAIADNNCPGCGGEIMATDTYSFLKELKDAIVAMKPHEQDMDSFIQGLGGWLMSNFSLKKLSQEIKPTKFQGIKKAGTESTPLDNFIQKTKSIEEARKIANEVMSVSDEEQEDQETYDETEDPEYTKAVLAAMEENPLQHRNNSQDDRLARLKKMSKQQGMVRREDE